MPASQCMSDGNFNKKRGRSSVNCAGASTFMVGTVEMQRVLLGAVLDRLASL